MAIHPGSYGLDQAAGLQTGREGDPGAVLVNALTQEDVGEVDGARLNPDHDLTGARYRIGHLLQAQRLGGMAEFVDTPGAHGGSPTSVWGPQRPRGGAG